MPVFPKGVPRFAIRPPCTTGDKGEPSSSVLKDAHRVFALIEDERHLTAQTLYHDIKRRIEEWESSSVKEASQTQKRKHRLHVHRKKHPSPEEIREAKDIKDAINLLELRQAELNTLENRCRIFREAQQNLNVDEDWTYASTHFGIITYYRREEDESLSIKLEGEMKDVPVFEQICVLKEVDLHYKWSPFCSSSMTIADLDKLDTVGWFIVGMPHFGLARDGCFRAIGCDNIAEDGTILLAGQGVHDRKPGDDPPADTYLVDDPLIEKLDIPPVPTRRGSGRMTIRKFEAVVHVISPTSVKTRIVANIDPNMAFLPQSLLEFVMKHLAGVMLGKLQGAARKITKHPVTNEHARLMREEEEFYKGWLMAKFQAICDERDWQMPRVAAFELSEDEIRKESRLKQRKIRRGSTFSGQDVGMEVVENIHLAQASSPSLTVHGDDSVSALTSKSARSGRSAWTNNPISFYLREMEEKVQKRKEASISETRKRAADRLRPKDLPFDKQERLEELKAAKARRLAEENLISTLPSNISDTAQPLSLSQKVTTRLHRHGRFMRFFVISFLVSLLFVCLHPDLVARVPPIKYDAESPRWILVLEDFVTVIYIAWCSVVHFVLCDVSLVYAFSALELGRKSGRQLKRFYSTNIRYGLAIGSFGIYAVSVVMAGTKVWFRAILWSTSRVLYFTRDNVWTRICAPMQTISSAFPAPVAKAVDFVMRLYLSTVVLWGKVATWIALVPTEWAYQNIIRSNLVGLTIEFWYRRVLAVLGASIGDFKSFVQYSIDGFEGNITTEPWRAEAFDTARTLFSYTAVFLVTSLFLFNLSARRSLQGENVPRKNASRSISGQSPEPGLESQFSSLSDDENPGKLIRTNSSRSVHRPIPEDEEVVEGTPLGAAPAAFFPEHPSENETSSSSSRKKRLRRLRFRRKTQSLSADKKQPNGLLQSDLRKSESC